MSRESELTIGFALVIAMVCGVSNAAAQADKYPRMAAIGQYLMEKNAEIQLARSASAAFHIFLLLVLAAFRPKAQSSGLKASSDRAGRERRGVGHS